MNGIPSRFKIQLFAFLALLPILFALWILRTGDDRMQQAEESYRKGEASTTIAGRNEFFNDALNLFLKLDEEYRPHLGTGKLDYNIGNTYFQLGEYPLAIFYYKRAENLLPRADFVKRNLAQAQIKSSVQSISKNRLFDSLLLKPWLSLPERIQIFFALALLSLVFISWWVWTEKSWLSKLSVFFLIPALVFLLNLGLTYYFSPLEAVLVRAAELRRDAGVGFALVSETPIPGGSIVEVIGTAPNGRWMKVSLPEGEFGYVTSESIKLIDL